MSEQLTQREIDLWTDLLKKYKTLYVAELERTRAQADFDAAKQVFLSADIHRVELFRQTLRDFQFGNEARIHSLELIKLLNIEDAKQLLPELVFLASWGHGALKKAQDLILDLPRDWVIAHIEEASRPVLAKAEVEDEEAKAEDKSADYGYLAEAYGYLLDLYSLLDRELARRLAKEAVSHPDKRVKAVGEEFL